MINTDQIKKSIRDITDQGESLGTLFDDYVDGQPFFRDDEVDPEAPTLDDVATSAVVTMHYAYTLVRELREAGAEIAEAPVEEEALLTFAGALATLDPPPAGAVGVADVGGGSSELTVGTAAAGGMLIGTIFGMVLIPGLYVLFASFEKPKNLDAEATKEPVYAPEPEPELVAH